MALLSDSRFLSVAGISITLLLITAVWTSITLIRAIRNLFFHPLSKYPGPKLWIAFPISKRLAQLRGQLDFEIRSCCEQYGEVVRTGPNELVFTTAKAWKDIYGHGHAELPKSFPTRSGLKFGRSIMNANAQDHFRFRRAMLPAFSDRALDQQEPLIQKYVDLLVEKLKDVARNGEPANFVKWYSFCTFDLIGDLAYGQSFGGLAEGKPNRWIENIENMMRLFPIILLATASPIISKAIMLLASDRLTKSREEHLKMTRDLAMQRIRNKDQEHRGDFMDFIMRAQGKEHGLSDDELVHNSDTLIVAGSETTATLLCGVTYYLLSTPDAHQKCVKEVRSAFDSDDQINFKAASARLPYMLACLDEALRLFPPLPTIMLRETLPGQMTDIDSHEIPQNTLVGVHHLATYHSSRNFHQARFFCPERWLPEAQNDPSSPFSNDNREALKPFSTGPRDCIGRNLAYHEMRLILAKVLWNFDLSLVESCQGWAEKQRTFALWEKSPLMINVREKAAMADYPNQSA